MDKRVFRMAILTIISAFILVLVVVYATNRDRINKLFGSEDPSASAEESATLESVDERIYGDQIGDDLSGFIYDEDFFDETEEIPSVVVITKSSSSAQKSVPDDENTEEEERPGTGMAVVGELENPDAAPAVDENGYLTSVPTPPPGGFGEYIPNTPGTIVGN